MELLMSIIENQYFQNICYSLLLMAVCIFFIRDLLDKVGLKCISKEEKAKRKSVRKYSWSDRFAIFFIGEREAK